MINDYAGEDNPILEMQSISRMGIIGSAFAGTFYTKLVRPTKADI
jgi:hypothetical protein